MRCGLVIAIAVLAAGCAGSPTALDPIDAAAREISRGRTLLPVAEGSWRVFDLPRGWIAQHLGQPGPRRAYISLVPAHAEDLEDNFGTCPPPQRIVLGVVERDQSRRERVLACLHVCGPTEDGKGLYRGLWASATYLEGVTAQVLEDGSIEVIEHYRELAFMTPEVAENPNVVSKLRFQGAPKRLHRSIAPSEFRFTGQDAGSCVGRGGG